MPFFALLPQVFILVEILFLRLLWDVNQFLKKWNANPVIYSGKKRDQSCDPTEKRARRKTEIEGSLVVMEFGQRREREVKGGAEGHGANFCGQKQPHILLSYPRHTIAPLPAWVYLFIHSLIYSTNIYCEPITWQELFQTLRICKWIKETRFEPWRNMHSSEWGRALTE